MAIVGARIVNRQKLEQAIVAAFEKWAEEDINDAHWDDQFRDMERWRWSGETRRKNGQVVDSPRDIYDLGTLYQSGIDSYRFTATNNRAEAYWYWDAKNEAGQEYASYVHDGTGFMDGRPFTNDIALPSSFFRKAPGKALILRMEQGLKSI
jgi:hypothetical protein